MFYYDCKRQPRYPRTKLVGTGIALRRTILFLLPSHGGVFVAFSTPTICIRVTQTLQFEPLTCGKKRERRREGGRGRDEEGEGAGAGAEEGAGEGRGGEERDREG